MLIRLRRPAGIDHLRQAKVRDFQDSFLVDQHIRRFDVPVNESLSVRILQRIADLADRVECSDHVEPARVNEVVQIHPIDIFHDDVVMTARRLAIVKDLNDVRVIQLGHGIGLAFKARFKRRVRPQLRRQQLDRHRPVQGLLDSLVNRAHSPRPISLVTS